MLRVALAMVIGGGFLGYYGYQEYQVGAGASSEAVHVALADLESGATPPDTHLQIGDHWAIYPSWVGWGSQDSDQLDYIYYPIVSEGHAYNQAWDRLLDRYGDSEIPESQLPRLTSLGVLVKTDRYKREGDVPAQWQEVPSITGLLVHEIDGLKSDEERLLNQNYPGLDLSHVMILEEGREPKSAMSAVGLILGGAALILFGMGVLVRSHQDGY